MRILDTDHLSEFERGDLFGAGLMQDQVSMSREGELNEVRRLLAEVRFQERFSGWEGIEPLQRILWKDDGTVLKLLREELPQQPKEKRCVIAFVIAARYAETGKANEIRGLYSDGDLNVKEGVLDGISVFEPGEVPEVAVELALEGVVNREPKIRRNACCLIKNLSAVTDVSRALKSVGLALEDSDGLVRMHAACAAGNFAKNKFDVTDLIEPLAKNLSDAECFVRVYSAWALWKSARRQDIGAAVERLIWLLSQPDWDLKKARINAAGALRIYGQKSEENRVRVLKLARGCLNEPNKQLLGLIGKVSG